ncbi:RraA family protein [Salinibacterium sp. SYSU T00001]|uniref:RraA family protein n=1 Tax=Homoserinimonas sedimenticola TaxID=2986805 RepID=UPI002235D5C4|nr:RraA family protein [Salinibacterium sedimenticola]MCW4384662.1 RraA family protein [Salinibacterium sedimenticola]
MTDVPPTAALADALVRLTRPVRCAPATLAPLFPTPPLMGPAVPVTHLGSVDVILESIDAAPEGGVLVVDNGARTDESCVGDLVVLEAKQAGLAAVIIWGLHRDTAQLRDIGLPVFSTGAMPLGPTRVPSGGDPMRSATLGGVRVMPGDMVAADDDGVLVLAHDEVDQVVALARDIAEIEARQAARMRGGESLRSQLDFDGYLERRRDDPGYSLREHLASGAGAIET